VIYRLTVQTLPDGLETQFTPHNTTDIAVMSCLAGGVNWTLENVRLFVCRGQPPQQLLAVLQPAPTELLSPSVYCRGLVFTARRHASKALAIVRCLSVFYVSVASRHRIETVERIKMVLAWRLRKTNPTLF